MRLVGRQLYSLVIRDQMEPDPTPLKAPALLLRALVLGWSLPSRSVVHLQRGHLQLGLCYLPSGAHEEEGNLPVQ